MPQAEPSPTKSYKRLLRKLYEPSVFEQTAPSPLLREFADVINSKRAFSRLKTVGDLVYLLSDRWEIHAQCVEPLLTILQQIQRPELKDSVEEYKEHAIKEDASCVCGNVEPLPPYEPMVPTAPSPGTPTACPVKTLISLQCDDLEKAFCYVSPFLAKSWRGLARQLGLREYMLDRILMGEPDDPRQQAYLALVQWRELQCRPSVEFFAQKLQEHGREELAQDIAGRRHLFHSPPSNGIHRDS